MTRPFLIVLSLLVAAIVLVALQFARRTAVADPPTPARAATQGRAPAVCGVAPRAPAGSEVTVYVDGVKVGPTDEVTGAPLNAFVVGAVPMIPVRLFDSVLHDSLDLYLWRWQVLQLSNKLGALVAFKLGDKVAVIPQPMVGGSVERPLYLPVAPQLIDDHLYIPAEAVLQHLGHAVKWDPRTRTLRTTKKADIRVIPYP